MVAVTQFMLIERAEIYAYKIVSPTLWIDRDHCCYLQ